MTGRVLFSCATEPKFHSLAPLARKTVDLCWPGGAVAYLDEKYKYQPGCSARALAPPSFFSFAPAVFFFAPHFPNKMSEADNYKNALVASLFELANAAQNTASATVNLVNHYKLASTGESADALATLAETLASVKGATASALESKPLTNGKAAPAAPPAAPPAADAAKAAAPAAAAANGQPPKKKAKVEKDPNAPKKPLTMYFAYSFDIRERIKEERKKKNLEPLSAVDMNGIIRDKWASITPEEKEKWQKKYQDEYIVYQKAKDAYDAKKKLEPSQASPEVPAEDSSESGPEEVAPTPAKSSKSSSKPQLQEIPDEDSTEHKKSKKKSDKKHKKSKK